MYESLNVNFKNEMKHVHLTTVGFKLFFLSVSLHFNQHRVLLYGEMKNEKKLNTYVRVHDPFDAV